MSTVFDRAPRCPVRRLDPMLRLGLTVPERQTTSRCEWRESGFWWGQKKERSSLRLMGLATAGRSTARTSGDGRSYTFRAHPPTFNYSDNDRKYRIGEGEYKFVTRWSPCGEDSVYLYRGGDHSSVALTDKSAIEVQQILSGPQGRGRTGGCNLQWAPPLGCGEGHRHRKGRAYVPVRHPDRWHVEVCTMSPGHQLPIGSDAF